MKKVLILEDEENIRSFVVINLQRAGYTVVEAGTGKQALNIIRTDPDIGVAILDIMLPDIDGFEVCRGIRATTSQMGIIMLTARTQEIDKVTGLMTGADDYVTKPFSPKEVMARINAVTKRRASKPTLNGNEILKFEGLEIDMAGRNVYVDGVKAELTPKEYELLFYLVRNKGIALTREKLLYDVWGFDFYGDDRTVDTHIKMLRGNLKDYRKYIVTLRGLGYKFEE